MFQSKKWNGVIKVTFHQLPFYLEIFKLIFLKCIKICYNTQVLVTWDLLVYSQTCNLRFFFYNVIHRDEFKFLISSLHFLKDVYLLIDLDIILNLVFQLVYFQFTLRWFLTIYGRLSRNIILKKLSDVRNVSNT